MEIINKENFAQKVINADVPVLVDFFANWCGPCKMLAPELEKFAEKHPEIDVFKVNVDNDMELAVEYKIEVIPTLILIKNGKVEKRVSGYFDLTELEQNFTK